MTLHQSSLVAQVAGSDDFWALVVVVALCYVVGNWEELFGGGAGPVPPTPGPNGDAHERPWQAAYPAGPSSAASGERPWLAEAGIYGDLPSVRAGKPKFEEPYLSATQVKVWDRCRHRWQLEYLKKLKPHDDESQGLKFGTVVHETLETVFRWAKENDYRGDLGSAEVRLVAMRAHSRALSGNWLYPNAGDAALDRCLDYLEGSTVGPHDEVLHVEAPITVTIKADAGRTDLLRLAGIPDLVMRRSRSLVEILDFKTHRRVLKPDDLTGDAAQAIYAMWAHKAFPGSTIRNTYALLKHHRTVSHEFSDDALLDVRSDFRQLDAEISTAQRGGAFPPSLGPHCFECPMRHHCLHYAKKWPRPTSR